MGEHNKDFEIRSKSAVSGINPVDYEGLKLPDFGNNVTKFAPLEALKLIAWRQADFFRKVCGPTCGGTNRP